MHAHDSTQNSQKAYMPRLKLRYQDVLRPKLLEMFSYSNPMKIPCLTKVVLNMGIGEAVQDTKKVQAALRDLSLIAGQKAVVTRARKSLATFKVREGMPIGVKVTLRGDRMYEFLNFLIYVAMPSISDFRGLNPRSFDGSGNYNFGLTEHIVFPQINYDEIDQIWGMDIAVCTSAQTDAEALALLRGFDFPFLKQ